MSKFHVDKGAQCPFYSSDSRQLIRCEGLIPGTKTQMSFISGKKMQDWMDMYCRGRYQKCEICKMLERKYDNNDRK